MPGAIIPDDWDGSTFECQRIEWPSSSQWRAILLGQVSEPYQSTYWDETTGSVDEATEAVVDAFGLTVPTIYTTGCDDMVPNIPVSTFKAGKDTGLGLAAATWTYIPWDLLVYSHNSPEFALPQGQNVTDPDLFGLWHYDLTLKVLLGNQIYMQAVDAFTDISIALVGSSDGSASLSWEQVWDLSSNGIIVKIWSAGATSLDIQLKNCQWSGHFLGPVIGA